MCEFPDERISAYFCGPHFRCPDIFTPGRVNGIRNFLTISLRWNPTLDHQATPVHDISAMDIEQIPEEISLTYFKDTARPAPGPRKPDSPCPGRPCESRTLRSAPFGPGGACSGLLSRFAADFPPVRSLCSGRNDLCLFPSLISHRIFIHMNGITEQAGISPAANSRLHLSFGP